MSALLGVGTSSIGKASNPGELGKFGKHGKSGKIDKGMPGPLFSMIPWLTEAMPGKGTLNVPRVTVVDVGAMDIGEQPVYCSLVEAGIADVVGFEPVEEECAKLNKNIAAREDASIGSTHLFFPVALGAGDHGIFRQCSNTMTSSLLEPNLKLLSQFHLLEDVTTVIRRSEIMTQCLDELLPELPGKRADFVKLDVQGYELEVLRGAETALRSALVVHTEVEFVEIYEKQALFADVDAYLRAHGFVFHRFYGVKGVPSRQMALPMAEPPYSQQLWADAVYVRGLWSREKLQTLEPAHLLRMALILHEVYLSYDAAHFVLEVYNPYVACRYRDMIMPRESQPPSEAGFAGRGARRGSRKDPTDGNIYTFAELLEKFSVDYDERELEMYWQHAMRPVESHVNVSAADGNGIAETVGNAPKKSAEEGEWDLAD